MECKTFTAETYFFSVGEKKSSLPPYNSDHSDDLNHPTEVPKGNLAVSEEQLHFLCSFLVFFCVLLIVC